jgi:hydroxyacylglutathione hydrolase
MLLERYYDDSLAQASYLIACEESREAIVIDPNAVTPYESLPRMRVRIKYVTETHIHADYFSGSRDLAAATRAELLLSGHGGADWSYATEGKLKPRLIRDGDTIMVGKVKIDVLHTPGHTPEHLSFVVTDTATGDRPMGIITGDFVFVGDVGRPDLLEKAAKVKGSMESSARDLFRSLKKLSAFPEYVQIWPGHGAGSACGKALGAVPQSTLGYERLYNPAFQHRSEDAFVKWVLADQPDAPPYFAVMKWWNRDGRPKANDPEITGSDNIPPDKLESMAATHQIVDTRSAEEFAAGHVPGSIHIPGTSRSFATYAGTVLAYNKPIILIARPYNENPAVIHALAMIGLSPRGVASPKEVTAAFRGSPRAATVKTTTAKALHDQPPRAKIIDVRNTTEWNEGHLPGATHIYLGDLAAKSESLKKSDPIVVHCQTGVRASIATSILMARGFTDVTNVKDGVDAWRNAGLPLQRDK